MNEKQKRNYEKAKHALDDKIEYLYQIKYLEKIDEYKKAHDGEIPDEETQNIIGWEIKKSVDMQQKRKQEITKLKKVAAMFGLTAGIAITALGSAKVGNMLTESKYKSAGIELDDNKIDVDASKVGNINIEMKNVEKNSEGSTLENISIQNENDIESNININDLNYNDLNEVQKLYSKLKENTITEIKGLPTKEEILNYAKAMFAEEYNSKNGTNYTADNVSYDVSDSFEKVIEKQIENGDRIICIKKSSDKPELNTDSGILTVSIDGIPIEKGVIYNDEYRHVYESDEVVECEDKNNYLTGSVLINAADYASSVDYENQTGKSSDDKSTYMDRLIYVSTKYKKDKIDKIVLENYSKDKLNENINISKSNVDNEEYERD